MQRLSSFPLLIPTYEPASSVREAMPRPRVRVLLVDDDELVRRALVRTIGEMYDVHAVGSSQDALEEMARSSFSAVISDIQLGDGTGIDLLKRARELGSEVPFIFVTGRPTVDTVTAALNLGAIRYLTKPVNSEELLESLKRAAMMLEFKELRARTASLPPVEGDPAVDDERRLYRAFRGIWMAFQPIVSWRDRSVIGYEALLRSQEPSLARPLDLIGCAERHGRIDELGKRCRTKVADSLASAPESTTVFVNLHASDLVADDLFDPNAPLSRYASRVILEITERSSLDSVDDIASRLARLRALGYQIAVDDLGAGYAGLSSVVKLEPDVVKFDMSLVRGIVENNTKQQLVQSMSRVCRELGMRVVVEGVETDLEAYTLARLGCDLFQGYLFARPARGFPEPTFPQE